MSPEPDRHTGIITVRVACARWARLTVVHRDGEHRETRADGHGSAVLTGLRAGTWSVTAYDARRDTCSETVAVTLAERDRAEVDLATTLPAARLLVDVRGGDRRPVLATHVSATDTGGRTVTAPLRGGLAHLRGLRPGTMRVVVPASVGHLGTTATVEVGPGRLGSVTAVVPVGATIVGRVVQITPQYAAVVTLLDRDGAEIERARTDRHGRFVLGAGLAATRGLTLVATSGPETLHVTRAAVADVRVAGAVRHDLGEIRLPIAGRPARWSAAHATASLMGLPSTRV